ncbi:hypothetical protein A2154_03875 [Candidatus Gottesmanbacteria bacterium RBG_16_43_7]|uniref:Uncharacterized protein n=1 Tax=Candidatus Gottesmanbacteria bacterium RBG_16_43_7 TaxID=1798373 RepID=A0A1F5Z918_9BACT|nr:MAG: hypothetical protein A2154_03875 [Candidatus Gottesmanbacteria bacterium RBG_16_43_7]
MNPREIITLKEIRDKKTAELFLKVWERSNVYASLLDLNRDGIDWWRNTLSQMYLREAWPPDRIVPATLAAVMINHDSIQQPIYIYVKQTADPRDVKNSPWYGWNSLLMAFSFNQNTVSHGGGGTSWITAVGDQWHEKLVSRLTEYKTQAEGQIHLPLILP